MKQHFIIQYVGNKREEVEEIFKFIDDKLEFIDTIVEPFCGSSAMSYYISTMYPHRFKYILNDNSKNLIELYKIAQDEKRLEKFIHKVNNLCFVDNKFVDKETYLNILNKDDEYSFFIKNKYYYFRPAVYPRDKINKKINYEDFNKIPIIKFLRTEEVIFTNMDAVEIIKEHNNENTMLLLDPPYLDCQGNSFYDNFNMNVYEYIHSNTFFNLYLIVEYNWIIRCLFKDKISYIYEKKYNGFKKKIVRHVVLKV